MRTQLLADDSVTTQRVVALTFAEESFRVVTVPDGQQALDAMAAMRPDIVLASTTLPRVTGYDLAQQMQGIAALLDVPVLLLSGAFESVDAARLKASGARGVVEKPLEPTAVISRVRELLGFKDTCPAALAGRLVASAEGPADRKEPARSSTPATPRAPVVSAWDELCKQTGLQPNARSVEGSGTGSGREDYLDPLDAAFDSLGQHLAGHQHDTESHRNPSPPLGQASGAAGPRSTGHRPSATSEGGGMHSVFAVDNDWFSDDHKGRDRAAGDEMVADVHEAMPSRTPAVSGAAIFEVDDECFAQDAQAGTERATNQRNLAAEMGIHDLDLPIVEPGQTVPASPDGLDFDFGLDQLATLPAPAGPVPDSPFAPLVVVAPPAPMPVAMAPMVPLLAPVVVAPMPPLVSLPSLLTNGPRAAAPTPAPAPAAPAPRAAAPLAPSIPPAAGSVADDFAALLAFETGDAPEPPQSVAAAPPAAPIVGQAVAPAITEVMLDQIAQRVADRLKASNFGTDLRDAMTSAIRDTVRIVVSDTSERLVREEIGRVKAKAERDTP